MDNRIKSANKSRVLYLDLLKVVAAIGVVAIHFSAENWRKIDIYSADWAIQTIYDGIMRCAVPIFIMVSGALFLGRDIPIKTLYKKYVLRLLIVFLHMELYICDDYVLPHQRRKLQKFHT
jgi:surface polysaccharide O-acyltransferase-like enzyme